MLNVHERAAIKAHRRRACKVSGAIHTIFKGCAAIKKVAAQGTSRSQSASLGKAGNAGDGFFEHKLKGVRLQNCLSLMCILCRCRKMEANASKYMV